MLLQHHTVSLINSGIPEGWEEEMAFGDEDENLEDDEYDVEE